LNPLGRKGENNSFAVGHIAFGYITGKTSAKFLKTNINLPLILTLSVIPDIDLFLFKFTQHRGPTHSIITALIIFTPFFIIYRKQAIPYFIALIQHGLIGDYFGGGDVQLLWPITNTGFGAGIEVTSLTGITIELTAFLIALTIMLLQKDIHTFFRPRTSNLLLIIPATTLLQAVLPTAVPFPLKLPSYFMLAIFSAAILVELYRTLSSKSKFNQSRPVPSLQLAEPHHDLNQPNETHSTGCCTRLD
jgi:membrane-bound metal-dependent hydrolase YbcI (DUF457 family)